MNFTLNFFQAVSQFSNKEAGGFNIQKKAMFALVSMASDDDLPSVRFLTSALGTTPALGLSDLGLGGGGMVCGVRVRRRGFS